MESSSLCRLSATAATPKVGSSDAARTAAAAGATAAARGPVVRLSAEQALAQTA